MKGLDMKNQIWNDQKRRNIFLHENCLKDWLRHSHSGNCLITPVFQAGLALLLPEIDNKIPSV